jgi:hypothetical protein
MALGDEQQSLNCVWFRCIGLRDDPADNRGVIVELPGRTAEMGDDGSRKSIGYVVGLVLENASSL